MDWHKHSDPLLRTLEAPLRGEFFPLGFRLHIETNDQRLLDCARSSFGVFDSAEFGETPARFRLMRDPHGVYKPPWPAATYRACGDWLAIVCGGDNSLFVDLGNRLAFGFFSPAMLDDTEFFRWTFLDCAVYMLLTQHDLSPMHAACVVKHGHGICLCGPAGIGKTALAYSLCQSGYALLADDVVHILRSSGQLRGNPSRIHFAVSARELFPELRDVPVGIRRDGAEFLAVPPRDLPGGTATRAELGPVMFLNREVEARSAALDAISAQEAFSRLAADLPLTHEAPVMEEHYRSIRSLVAGGAFRLTYSTLADARRLIEKVALPERVTG